MPGPNFTAHSYTPDCNVIFFPYVNEVTYDPTKQTSSILPGSSDATNVKEFEAGPDVIQCSTSKAKGTTGTFSILLSSRVNYKALLEAGAWVMIYMSDSTLPPFGSGIENSPSSGFKMLGLVRSVRRKEVIDPQTGTLMTRYLVSGEDFQSLLQTPIYLNAQLSQQARKNGDTFVYADLLLNLKLKEKQSPDSLLTRFLEAFLGSNGFSATNAAGFEKNPVFANARNGVPIRVPPVVSSHILGSGVEVVNNSFSSFLTLLFQTALSGIAAFTNTISGTVDVWSVMQTYQNPTLNELYTEMIPVLINGSSRMVPSIVFRPIPYNSPSVRPIIKNAAPYLITIDAQGSPGTAIRDNNQAVDHANRSATFADFYISKQIQESDIVAFDSGKTDKELFNFVFFTTNTGLPTDPVSNLAALNLLSQGNGSQKLTDQTSITRHGLRPFITSTNYLLSEREVINSNILLRDMWINAQFYENGTVSIRGDSTYIPVGTNIAFSDRGWIAHVEQVDNSFSVDQSSGRKQLRTNLVFVRLQNTDGTYIDPVDHQSFFDGINQQGPVNLWERGFSGVKDI